MGRYELGKFLFAITSDRNNAAAVRFREDPDAVCAEFGLSASDRAALEAGDIRAMYETGVHPLLVRMGCNELLGPTPGPKWREILEGVVAADD